MDTDEGGDSHAQHEGTLSTYIIDRQSAGQLQLETKQVLSYRTREYLLAAYTVQVFNL
jgi:hypothetical protein